MGESHQNVFLNVNSPLYIRNNKSSIVLVETVVIHTKIRN